ncbi:hypothetical protein F4805DRAFT_182140 [Annulohypoxylon moriforme]|nr:hypothetical protein F4805DRAFT_182140 [Annulohypoxylon moriforme]
MKFTLLPLLLAAAAFVSALPSAEPGRLFRRMTCSGGLDTPCQDLCVCTSDGTVNCHADPTSRCVQMCSC